MNFLRKSKKEVSAKVEKLNSKELQNLVGGDGGLTATSSPVTDDAEARRRIKSNVGSN